MGLQVEKLNLTIGFIGAGNMAEAIIGALLKSDIIDAGKIIACDIDKTRLNYMSDVFNINVTENVPEAYRVSDIVILAVKPQIMEKVLSTITSGTTSANDRKIVISIAAGIKICRFEDALYTGINNNAQANLPIIRVMPNTPGLVLSGMSALCPNKNVLKQDMALAKTILGSMGKVLEVEEEKMDAVTAVSGSGPAYFFYFAESMVEEAISLGLTREEAMLLTITTMEGAASLLKSSDDSPETLRKKVTSPGGTTEAAINIFESSKTKDIIRNAVAAAAKRSQELS